MWWWWIEKKCITERENQWQVWRWSLDLSSLERVGGEHRAICERSFLSALSGDPARSWFLMAEHLEGGLDVSFALCLACEVEGHPRLVGERLRLDG